MILSIWLYTTEKAMVYVGRRIAKKVLVGLTQIPAQYRQQWNVTHTHLHL